MPSDEQEVDLKYYSYGRLSLPSANVLSVPPPNHASLAASLMRSSSSLISAPGHAFLQGPQAHYAFLLLKLLWIPKLSIHLLADQMFRLQTIYIYVSSSIYIYMFRFNEVASALPKALIQNVSLSSGRVPTMVVQDNAPLPSSVAIEEKESENERELKDESPPALQDTRSTAALDFDSSSVSNLLGGSIDYQQGENVCSMFRTADFDDLRHVGWNENSENHLEEILMSYLDAAFKLATQIVSLSGYAEDIAMDAVLRSRTCYGRKDMVSNIVNNALTFLGNGQNADYVPRENAEEDLKELEKNILVDMVIALAAVRAVSNVGDALWWLLLSDGNIHHPSVNNNLSNSLGTNEIAGKPTAPQLEMADSVPRPEKEDANDAEERSCSTSVQSLLDQKPASTRNFQARSSKRKSVLRNFDKSCRALKSKEISRARKHGSPGDLAKCTANLETTTASLKNSSVKQPKAGADKTFADGKDNPSYDLRSTSCSSDGIKDISGQPATFMADTDTSLPMSATRPICLDATKDSRQAVTNSGNYSAISPDNVCSSWISDDERDEMHLLLVTAVQELKDQLQEWTDWTHQKIKQATHRAVLDKAEVQLLKQEKNEVKKERQTMEDDAKKKIAIMEYAVAKVNEEVERANASAHWLELENVRLRNELEAAKLHAMESSVSCQKVSEREMVACETLHSLDGQRKLLQEELLSMRHQLSMLQKQFQQVEEHHAQTKAKWRNEEKLKDQALAEADMEKKRREQIETSTGSLETHMLMKLENDLQRRRLETRRLEQQRELLWKLVEDPPSIAEVEGTSSKTSSSQLMSQRKTFNDRPLTNLLCSLDLGQEDLQTEVECIMCLSEETSVVFLPCAHQVFCTHCNELHLSKGMQDCPTCRIPIERRISVRWAESQSKSSRS